MREFDEKSITQAVIGRLSQSDDPRFKRVMTSLITHLHDFVRDVKLTEPEWLAAIEFLTDVGQTCTSKRQEFILLSDTLGVSVLVITLNHPADQGSVESTVLGPFYWEGAPELPRGSNLAEAVKGEPTFIPDACSAWMAGRSRMRCSISGQGTAKATTTCSCPRRWA